MLCDDCKHADFQMFDKTVQKYQKGTVNSFCHKLCWVSCFLGILRKWFRREKNWRFVYHLSNSNSSIIGKENFVSKNRASFPNLLLLCSEIGAVWFAWTYIYCCPPIHLNKLVHQSNKIWILNTALHIPRNIPFVYQPQINSDLSQNILLLGLSLLHELLFYVLILDSHYSWWKSSKKN